MIKANIDKNADEGYYVWAKQFHPCGELLKAELMTLQSHL